jgi:type III pantothenate kinase
MSDFLIAVDVGNSRLKLGLFDSTLAATQSGSKRLPNPVRSLALPAVDWNESALKQWTHSVPRATPWRIASVNRSAATRLVESIQSIDSAASLRMLSHHDLPITVAVKEADKVGIDRLAAAAAANQLRDPARAAIVIHVGTAIVVDLVSADRQFCGGAILPGIAMSARALHEFTDLLPQSPMQDLREPPPAALGTSTLAAIHGGLYWGAIGAMRELVTRLADLPAATGAKADVFVTGGAAPAVANQLGPDVQCVEHLVLSGVALAATRGGP